MQEEHELRPSIEHIPDEEVTSAIRYLDPDVRHEKQPDTSAALVICISLIVLFVGALAYIWVYLETL